MKPKLLSFVQLLQEGRAVIAATRDADKGQDLFAAAKEQYGRNQLSIEGGIDVTDKASLGKKQLWQGVSQVAIAVGPVFGRQAGGEMGYEPSLGNSFLFSPTSTCTGRLISDGRP